MTKEKKKGKLYHMTDNLGIYLQTATKAAMKYVGEQLEYYIEQYHRIRLESNAESAAFNFHVMIDAASDKKVQHLEKENLPVSCRKGCSFCCKLHVDITKDEGILLLAMATEEKINFDMKKILRQAEHDSANWTKQDIADWGCVFLDPLKGECKVYKHRPAACRSHFVVSDPKDCDPTVVTGTDRMWDLDSAILVSAPMNASETNSMAKTLKKLLIKTGEDEQRN